MAAPPVAAAFGTLTLALALLWAARASMSAWAARLWTIPCAVALIGALVGGVIDARGLFVLFAFAAACAVANRAASSAARNGINNVVSVIAHAIMLAIGAGLFLHVTPGIDNPRVIADAVLGPGAASYTKYLNFDKGIAGLFLLGIYAPDRPARDEGLQHAAGFLWRSGGPAYVILASAAGLGYGWVYASTRSIGAAIVTHAGLNAVHFFFFTYPALVTVG